MIDLLNQWGFKEWGIKKTKDGNEKVYVRNLKKEFNWLNPKTTFPYMSSDSKIHFVSILPIFHTDLLPDSMLKTESAENFVEDKPHRNALSKIYISHAKNRDLKRGDILLFYRTKEFEKSARHSSVITTLGIIESVRFNIKNEREFITLCGKRSVFGKDQLSEQWNKFPSKPFIINFLYTYSFPKRITLQNLIDLRIIPDVMSVPSPFEEISKENFEKILKATETDKDIIVQQG